MQQQVLITDPSGQPRMWADIFEGACYHARGKVVWPHGEVIHTFLGGKDKNGNQSRIDVTSILYVTGPLEGTTFHDKTSQYTDKEVLFGRDRDMCAYCGEVIPKHKQKERLTIDHIIPKSRGGKNVWMNTVAACKSCNHRKGDRTPEEAGTPLLYVPYVPNRFEKMLLKGKNVLADQMEFLLANIPKTSRLWNQQ